MRCAAFFIISTTLLAPLELSWAAPLQDLRFSNSVYDQAKRGTVSEVVRNGSETVPKIGWLAEVKNRLFGSSHSTKATTTDFTDFSKIDEWELEKTRNPRLKGKEQVGDLTLDQEKQMAPMPSKSQVNKWLDDSDMLNKISDWEAKKKANPGLKGQTQVGDLTLKPDHWEAGGIPTKEAIEEFLAKGLP